jgi:SAM-dependent methyltransferase
MAEVPYDHEFYSRHGERSLESARIVAPLVMKLAKIRSVIDIGCGVGGWLKAFEENGVAAVRGVDGNYVDRSALYIAPESFTAVDLSRQVAQINLENRYDLAICLEVVEHLNPSSACQLVDILTNLAPLILFSAAVPGQGGIGHVNEQWPEYWRDQFRQRNFEMFDPIRPLIREDHRVEWWYRQNILMFADRSALSAFPGLGHASEEGKGIEWIHVNMICPPHAGLRNLLTHMKPVVTQAMVNRLHRATAAAKRIKER